MSRLKNTFLGAIAAQFADAMQLAAIRELSGVRAGPYVYTRQNLGKSYGITWRVVGRQRCTGPRGGKYDLLVRVPSHVKGRLYTDPGYACNKHLKRKRK